MERGRNRAVLLAAIVLAALASSGCSSPPDEAVERLAEVRRSGEELDRSVKELEGRLLGIQANVLLWQELARRHRQVSAIAIVNQTEHLEAMLKLFDKQQEKSRKHRRRRTAAAQACLSGAVASNRHKPGD